MFETSFNTAEREILYS